MIGVGTTGCKIVSQLQSSLTVISRTFYVSTDESDTKNLPLDEVLMIPDQLSGKGEPSLIRAKMLNCKPIVEQHLRNVKIAFIVGSLAGANGSSLIPFLANVAEEQGVFTIGFTLMPRKSEKTRHFRAGSSLRRLKNQLNSLVVVDVDSIFERSRDRPIIEAYETTNKLVSLSIEKLLSTSDNQHYPSGLGNLLNSFTRGGYSMLSLGSSSSPEGIEDAVIEAVHSLYRTASPKDVNAAVLHLIADQSLTVNDVETSSRRISNLLGDNVSQINNGFTLGEFSQTAAILLTSGFNRTKFDEYDPVGEIFDRLQNGKPQLDEEPECILDVNLPLDNME